LHALRRASSTPQGGRFLVLAAGLLVLVVILGVGLFVFSAMSRDSQSYRDGFSIGGAVYSTDSASQEGASQACEKSEMRGPSRGGLPVGDNPTQWLKGCVAAFESAQGGN
jgi:hypothetical protein